MEAEHKAAEKRLSLSYCTIAFVNTWASSEHEAIGNGPCLERLMVAFQPLVASNMSNTLIGVTEIQLLWDATIYIFKVIVARLDRN